MSKKMPSATFIYLQNNYPEDFAEMLCLEIEVSNFSMFRSRRRTKKKKTIKERYGEQLTDIIEWLNENCSEPYYPRVSQNQKLSWDTTIEFYFTDDADAMAFKLMFE